MIDAAIQRFEFCFELEWKTLKVFLEFEGQEAFRIQWIADEPGGTRCWTTETKPRTPTKKHWPTRFTPGYPNTVLE